MFGDSVRRPSEAVGDGFDGLGGPSYKRGSAQRDRHNDEREQP